MTCSVWAAPAHSGPNNYKLYDTTKFYVDFYQILLDGPGVIKFAGFGISRVEGEDLQELFDRFSEAGQYPIKALLSKLLRSGLWFFFTLRCELLAQFPSQGE